MCVTSETVFEINDIILEPPILSLFKGVVLEKNQLISTSISNVK